MAIEQPVAIDPTLSSLEAFDRAVEAAGLRAGFRAGGGGPHMEQPYPPRRWRWAEIEPLALRSTELVKPGPEVQRRTLSL